MPPSAAGPVPVSSYLSKRTSFPFLASDRSASPVAPPQQFPPRGGSANIASWFSLQHPSTGVAYTANSGGITASASVIPEEDLPPPSVLEELDAAQDLLIRLERENASLRLDPKSVLVEQGSLMAHLDTMQSLSEYHLKLSSEMREEDVAFWKSVIDDHQASMQKIPHLLVVKIRSGIPPQLRNKIWQLMAGAEPEALASVYNNLLQEESPADRIIKRDIPRTFPKLDLFKDEGGVGQKSLYNLLKAYSIYDADCGYCQGLSFVVAPLILQNMSEVECFSVFVRLMEETPSRSSYRRYALRSLFTPQMPGLHVILFQHSELVRLCLPHLFNHFVAHGVMADTYASPWFLTLFTYNFPLPLVFRIFDIIFAEGATETMMRFSIAILKRNQHRILAEQDLEGILEILKGDSLYKVYEDDPERVVQDAMALEGVITSAVLDKLVSNFVAERKIRSTTEMEATKLRWEAKRLTAENTKLGREVASLRDALRTAEERRLRDLRVMQADYEAVVDRLHQDKARDAAAIDALTRRLALAADAAAGVGADAAAAHEDDADVAIADAHFHQPAAV